MAPPGCGGFGASAAAEVRPEQLKTLSTSTGGDAPTPGFFPLATLHAHGNVRRRACEGAAGHGIGV